MAYPSTYNAKKIGPGVPHAYSFFVHKNVVMYHDIPFSVESETTRRSFIPIAVLVQQLETPQFLLDIPRSPVIAAIRIESLSNDDNR